MIEGEYRIAFRLVCETAKEVGDKICAINDLLLDKLPEGVTMRIIAPEELEEDK